MVVRVLSGPRNVEKELSSRQTHRIETKWDVNMIPSAGLADDNSLCMQATSSDAWLQQSALILSKREKKARCSGWRANAFPLPLDHCASIKIIHKRVNKRPTNRKLSYKIWMQLIYTVNTRSFLFSLVFCFFFFSIFYYYYYYSNIVKPYRLTSNRWIILIVFYWMECACVCVCVETVVPVTSIYQ